MLSADPFLLTLTFLKPDNVDWHKRHPSFLCPPYLRRVPRGSDGLHGLAHSLALIAVNRWAEKTRVTFDILL